MHDDVTRLGEIIKAAREARDWSQALLSSKVGAASRTIMDIENGKRLPTYEVFSRLIHVLELPPDQIFWPERSPYTSDQELLMRAVSSCSERDRAIFMETAWAFIRAAGNGEEKK
jgi:transcriptional regulator with XRE-family HTH domain